MTNGLGGSWSTRRILGIPPLPSAGTDFGDARGVSATSSMWGAQVAHRPNRRKVHALQSICQGRPGGEAGKLSLAQSPAWQLPDRPGGTGEALPVMDTPITPSLARLTGCQL